MESEMKKRIIMIIAIVTLGLISHNNNAQSALNSINSIDLPDQLKINAELEKRTLATLSMYTRDYKYGGQIIAKKTNSSDKTPIILINEDNIKYLPTNNTSDTLVGYYLTETSSEYLSGNDQALGSTSRNAGWYCTEVSILAADMLFKNSVDQRYTTNDGGYIKVTGTGDNYKAYYEKYTPIYGKAASSSDIISAALDASKESLSETVSSSVDYSYDLGVAVSGSTYYADLQISSSKNTDGFGSFTYLGKSSRLDCYVYGEESSESTYNTKICYLFDEIHIC